MSRKYEDVFQLMQQAAADVIQTPEKWRVFLDSAAMNYKRPFYNQLLIFCQRPDATACATFDYWNKKLGRFVKKGSKGIVTLDLAAQNKEILFDISDTDSRTGAVVPIWSVTEDMRSPLALALQEHFETEVSSGDLAAVLCEIGERAAVEIADRVASDVGASNDGRSVERYGSVALGFAVKETLINSVQYMLLKRCGLDPDEQFEAFDFPYIKFFDSPEAIAAFGSTLNSVTKELFKDISLSARSIEKILSLSENKAKEAEDNVTDVHTTRGLSDSERVPSETGDKLREVRDHAQIVSDERKDRGVHGTPDERNIESAFGGDRQQGTGAGEQLGAGNGLEGGRDGKSEGDGPNAVGRIDEQLPDGSRGDRSGTDDLYLTSSSEDVAAAPDVSSALSESFEEDSSGSKMGGSVDERHPALSLEYVLEHILQHHKHLHVSGAEIQNYFLDHMDMDDRTGYLWEAYNKEYTELLTPDDGYRLGYHAAPEGLEVWIGAYLGSSSRVVVPWNVVVGAVDLLINNDQYLSLSEKVEIPSEEEQTISTEISDNDSKPFVRFGSVELNQEEAEAMAEQVLRELEQELNPTEKPKINRKIMACRNYTAFKKFAEDVLSGKYRYMRFESEAYEPLYVERIGENMIAMAHTYMQGGDMFYDPEMVFSFDNEKEELQALSYELSSASLYQRVLDEKGNVNAGLRRELNSFLNTWLKNIIEQDQPLVCAIDREGNELTFGLNNDERPAQAVPGAVAVSELNAHDKPEKPALSGESFDVGAALLFEGKKYKVVSIQGTEPDDEVILEEIDNPGNYYTDVFGYIKAIWEKELAGDPFIGFNDKKSYIDASGRSWITSSGFDFDEYLKIKDLYPDDLVAYQVFGDYEFFGEDAEKVAKELGRPLSFRDVGLSELVLVCEIRDSDFRSSLDNLIQNGYNIAVHGLDKKSGKVVTVDYETTFIGNRNNFEEETTSEKLIFDELEQPERDDGAAVSRANRGVLLDYRIEHLAHSAKSTKERYRQNVAAISLLKQLESDGRLATAEEQKVLASYVGWGGLADAFDENKSSWASEFAELKALLTPEEYTSAKASTLTSFYTPPEIIQFMYKTLEDMGFKKGNILEPSCGVGNFIGMLPENLSDSRVYGVELDSLSGRIARQLYQKQDIRIQGFEKTDFPDSFFDVAIGNVPFGDFKVNDKKFNKNNFLIHDYFFAKALDKVRPGGVIAFITSKGTMDKENMAVRQYLAERAEFLGAVRLPDNAFKVDAGTEVTSDIIFLQKRDRAIEIDPYAEEWCDLSYLRDPETGHRIEDPNGEFMEINSYFARHPEHILGEMKVRSTQYGYDTVCKARPGDDLAALLRDVHIEAQMNLNDRPVEEQVNELASIPADPDVRNFSYTLVDGAVYFRENSQMFPMSFPSEDVEGRVKALIQLRDAVRLLIDMQKEDYSERAIIKQRDTLNVLYDSFSKKYGLINDRKNRKAFESDSSYYLLASLETLDEEGKLKQKADIFHKRTIRPHVAVTSVDTSAEALEVSISEKACVDIPFMMELSGKTAEELEQDLVGVIFRVPYRATEDGDPIFVPADEYLSGNVRQKLKDAKAAAKGDALFAPNVSALEQVQPKELDASEISVRLGSTWIPTEYIKEFMFELLETPQWLRGDSSYCMDVLFSPATGEWFIENKTRDSYNVRANTAYGTERASAYKIIEDTLNLRDSRVYDYVEDEQGRKKAVLNRVETSIAQQKQELIKEAFVDWIWKDAERREFLTKYYNDHFNCIRPREYDGSHLTFAGMNSEITLQKHQLNAIARILYGGNTLLAHAVGAGKTFEMVAAAQESKRLGLCNKSMFVVPNHLIEQFAADYMRLYPSANVLCSTKKDFEPANRKKFCGRIATGDYDAIIIGHSQFEKIPMSTEGQRRALQEQLDDIERGIIEMKEKNNERFSVKQLEKTKKNLEVKLERLNDDSRKDDVVTFEELGVDRLFVDEAHYYKNLFLYTKMRNVAGIGSREAQKSSDLFMKCRYLDKLTDNRGVIFATGTPISNSMTELYTMQRYLQYELLCENGMQHFDSWASTFGETLTAIELAPEGTGYRAKTRFARFNNLPELMSTFKEMADVQTADMLHLPVPKANYHTVALQPSEIQKDYVLGLADRAKAIHDKKVSPNEDNMLLVTNDGRKLALDQRLIDPLFGDYEDSKVNACAENVFRIWNDNHADRSTQLVFCDLSTPKGGEEFDVYTSLRDILIQKGIPEKEIAFIHNAKTEQQKKILFENVRKGKVRVLLGSTQKLGAGTNVQDRLIALHDLDCPWRPSDLEQRSGRIVRQGNSNDEVEIFRYVTKDTFDAYLYQLIENKQNFISQIMTSKSLARSAEDVDEAVLSYAEIKSLATGDPRIKEKMDLDITVKRLKLLKQSYLREKYSLEDKVLKTFPKDIAYFKDAIEKCKRDNLLLEQYSSADKDYFFPMTVDGRTYTEKSDAGEAIIEACRQRKRLAEEVLIGEYRGFKMSIGYDILKQTYQLSLKNELRYTVPLGPDKFGNIVRINNLLDSLPARLQAFEEKLANVHIQMENAKKQLEKPFTHEQELKEKSARLDQLNVELSLDKDSSIDISSSMDEKGSAEPQREPMLENER